MWRCNDELRIRASELQRSSKRDAKHYIGTYRAQSFFFNFYFSLWDLLDMVA